MDLQNITKYNLKKDSIFLKERMYVNQVACYFEEKEKKFEVDSFPFYITARFWNNTIIDATLDKS